jgi:hypothetical protein
MRSKAGFEESEYSVPPVIIVKSVADSGGRTKVNLIEKHRVGPATVATVFAKALDEDRKVSEGNV